MNKLILLISVLGFSFQAYAVNIRTTFLVTDFGAKGDGVTNNREMIQEAIDAAYAAGGGTVIVPPGNYLTGSVVIKDNVTFKVEAGATLLGSDKLYEYDVHTDQHGVEKERRYLISVLNAKNVTICGKGKIDGQGKNFWNSTGGEFRFIKAKSERPNSLLEIDHSINITIRDVTLTNSSNWTCHISESQNINISGINIFNDLLAPNSDGIDISGCRWVRVSNCNIQTGDDAIVLKTWKNGNACEDIAVTNCNLESLCAALKLGTESYHDFRRIVFSSCTVTKSSRLFAIYVRDGATVEDVVVSNITGDTNAPLVLNRPVQLMITKRNPESKLGTIQNIQVQNLICKTEGHILLTADDGGILKNINLKNIHLDYPFIENPDPVAVTTPSSQFPGNLKGVCNAKAAIVAYNISNLVIRDLTIDWPVDTIPENWKLPVRLENGSFENQHHYSYNSPRQTEFHVLYGKKLKGGLLDNSSVNASSEGLEKYVLDNSTITILEGK